MCNFDREFKLCTCDKQETQHRKNTRKHKKEQKDKEVFVWTLYAYKGSFESFMDGMTAIPTEKLGKQEFSSEYILYQLNQKNCFDFEYSPKEDDYLVIEVETTSWNDRIMPFIYRENKWIFDSYNPFYDKVDKINKRKVVFTDKEENLPT